VASLSQGTVVLELSMVATMESRQHTITMQHFSSKLTTVQHNKRLTIKHEKMRKYTSARTRAKRGEEQPHQEKRKKEQRAHMSARLNTPRLGNVT